MSKTFTRYEAEFHDPTTRYVLAEEHNRELNDMASTMIAAAEEINEHWPAHCDEEGYGPANLMHRLEKGIAACYPGYTAGSFTRLEVERDRLQRMADTLTRELADARHELAMERMRHNATRAALEDERRNATRYPVENPANPLLTVESGGIRYVLEVFSDEDYGDWFEVKRATPAEPLGLCNLHPSAVPAAREALRQWREATRRDTEESLGV